MIVEIKKEDISKKGDNFRMQFLYTLNNALLRLLPNDEIDMGYTNVKINKETYFIKNIPLFKSEESPMTVELIKI